MGLRQSSLHERMLESVRATSLSIATQRSPHANGWDEGSGSTGVATTGEIWWKPRCIASNGWASV